MKATERYFLVILFAVVQDCSNKIVEIEQYFPVVLFIMLYKVVLTFESVDEILKCDHSLNESCRAVLSYGLLVAQYFAKLFAFLQLCFV